jgi:hypothetical protein
MTGLETAYYIIAIVFMSLLLLIGIGVAIGVLVISKKISAFHASIEEKISKVTDIAHKGTAMVDALKKVTSKIQK